jgi:membrane associated rhomboid family serine protease
MDSEKLLTVTNIIIGFTVVVSFYAFNNQEAVRKLIMNPYAVKTKKEYFRFISSGFIHGDHIHLLFNMISMYFFGSIMERIFHEIFGGLGTLYFLALYFLGIIVSDIPTYFKNQNNPAYNALGASGGVSAVIFAFILFLPLEKIYFYFAIPVPGALFGVIYLVYSWYQGKKGGDNINHDAHLYGALFGIIFCLILYPPSLGNFIRQVSSVF